jgi:hypothetical protein
MSWRRVGGISAFCAVLVRVVAVRCALPTGSDAAIPTGSASNISLGLAQKATIYRCSGRPSDIRVREHLGSISSTKEGAVHGDLVSGWYLPRGNLPDCCGSMNMRPVWQSRVNPKCPSASSFANVPQLGLTRRSRGLPGCVVSPPHRVAP